MSRCQTLLNFVISSPVTTHLFVRRPAGQSNGLAIVAVTLLVYSLLVGAIVAALFYAGIFDTHETDRARGSSGGPTSAPTGQTPVPTGAAQATTTPTTTSTTTSTTTTTPRPKPRILMCTIRYPGPRNNPPARVCDIVVYDAGKTDIGDKPPDEVKFYIDYCKQGHTRCGLNIEYPDGVLQQLDTPETKRVMKDFYKVGIKNYGLLRSEITTTSTSNSMRDQVSVLKKLETFMKVTGDDRDTLFWGVSPLLEGTTSPPNTMVQLFMDTLKSSSINLIVYQTTYSKKMTSPEPNCISTGTAMWTSATFPEQPAFVDALNFRKALGSEPLQGVAEALVFMLCCYWAGYNSNVEKIEFGYKKDCKEGFPGPLEEFVCVGAKHGVNFTQPPTFVQGSLQHLSIGFQPEPHYAGGYDLKDTILQKMCMASVNYGFDGGWVMHGLQCHFAEFCGGKDVGGFPRVRVVKDAMQQTFTKCGYTP